MMKSLTILVGASAMSLAACGGAPFEYDPGQTSMAAAPQADAPTLAPDAGDPQQVVEPTPATTVTPGTDSGPEAASPAPLPDAGAQAVDAGSIPLPDAGSPAPVVDPSAAYHDFLPMVEAYLRSGTLGPTAPMRVATVTDGTAASAALAAAAEPALGWNGGKGIAQNSGCYLATDASVFTPAQVAQQLAAFAPDVVVSFAGDGMLQVISGLEALDAVSATAAPFYLLGPDNDLPGSPVVPASVPTTRIAGIGQVSEVYCRKGSAYADQLLFVGGSGSGFSGSFGCYVGIQ
jgi:hypothetical protein